jgi:hypothetical protein
MNPRRDTVRWLWLAILLTGATGTARANPPTPGQVTVPTVQAAPAVALPSPATSTLALPTDADLEEAWARVYVRANPGPFQYLAYEITARGPAGVASHVRGVMGRRDPVTRTELLSKDKLRLLMGQLRSLGALDLPHPPVPGQTVAQVKPPPPAKGRKAKVQVGVQAAATQDDPLQGPPTSAVPIYELSFRLGGRENSLLVADPFTLEDRRYAACIQAVRDLAIATAGEIGYPGPTGRAGEEGRLFIDSVPSAKVYVDGELLPDETPILSYTVASGSHTIVLENPRLGLKREYKVKVQPGLTTSLEVELR